MAHNPYPELQTVYNAKVAWGNATTDEERKRQNDIANAARKKLEAYGFGELANQVSASGADANAVKKIMDSWAKVSDTVTGSYKSGVNNPAYNQSMTAASNKNDDYFNIIKSDHDNINNRYNSLLDYANSDVINSDVVNSEAYKSAFKNIMPSYTLAAMQGRDNAAASGAASNGGNIDSFAAANAMRQQAALTAKGQALAHQAGIDAYRAGIEGYNARVGKVQEVLSNLGIYNQGIYSAIDSSINNDKNIANDYFNNAETAKNNDVTRKSQIASVTGYVPDEWVVSNNPYMNDDGTIKDEFKDVDFSIVMQKAKDAGNMAAYNNAAMARYYKIMGNYGLYGQYDDGNYTVPGAQRTADYDLTVQQMQNAKEIAQSDNDASLAETNAQLASNERIADIKAKNNIDQINATAEAEAKYGTNTSGKPALSASQAVAALKRGEITQSVIDAYNYWYDTDYTVNNPPIGKTVSGSNVNSNDSGPSLTEKEVTDWVDFLNNEVSDKYPGRNALKQVGKNKYEPDGVSAEYIIVRVLESDDLTQEQKEFLLYNKFGITEDQVYTTMRDRHYK